MAIKRWNASTSQWELVGTPGTASPSAIGAAGLVGGNTFSGNQIVASNSYISVGDRSNIAISGATPLNGININNSSSRPRIGFFDSIGEDTTGSSLGTIEFFDYLKTGQAEKRSAIIEVVRDGSSSTQRGGAIVFNTVPNASNSITERMRIDSSGNLGINNMSPVGFNSSGKVLNITGTSANSGPSTIMQIGSSATPGAGYAATEVFSLTNIQNAVEVTRVTGTGANGFRAYFKVIVTGHNGSIGNGINIKEFYWDGGTSAPVQISTYTSSFAPAISFDTAVNNRLVVLLASSNGSSSFNGVMKIEWMLPIDFASSTYTLS